MKMNRRGKSSLIFAGGVLVVVAAMICSVALRAHGYSVALGQMPEQIAPALPKVVPDVTQTPAVPGTHELTAEDVATFLDGYVPGQMERQDIAGAVVIIVKDGAVLYGRGYGYADVATKKPVSVDDTLFRPGSVSKLFTCTAVMQLVEQGKLDLDRDVNDYIDFKIPATYAEPITLRRIMTHTTGFEEWDKELFVANTAAVEPIGVVMRENLPQRVFAPGAMPAYSNYAMALAGYIVQRVSGEQFEDYISNHILKPLAMTHATFVQPLPADLAPLMSSGYESGSEKAKGFEWVNCVPAGAMSIAAGDITRFMMAHLQDGRYGDAQILRPETARMMHSRAFAMVPELNGMALGFFQEDENGHKIIGHGGDTQYFHSHLHLILDANTGMFISVNSAGRGDIRGQLWHKFLDRYFPGGPALPAAISTAAQDAKTVSGNYMTSRRGETTITKLLALSDEATFSPDPEDTISSPAFLAVNGQPRHWREIGPMLYRDVNSQTKIAFRKNSKGELEMFSDAAAFGEQRATGAQNGNLFLFVLVSTLSVLALTVLVWPIAAMTRRHYHFPLALGDVEKKLRKWTKLVCVLDIVILCAWVEYLNYALGSIDHANRHLDWALDVIHVLQVFAIAATIVPIVYALGAWFSKRRWKWNRLFDTLTAAACVGFVWILYVCNFIHFGTKY